MSKHIKWLAIATIAVAGCSSDNDNNSSPPVNEDIAQTLVTLDGTEINAQSLTCIYRQNTGADTSLQLQLQYLASPDTVAFALYIDDPVPAEPYTAVAGQQGLFEFEAILDDAAYRDQIMNSEIEVQLDTLPPPSSLSDGDTVSLKGKLLINQFSMVERPTNGGETISRVIDLAAGSVDVDCEAAFQIAEVQN